MDEAWEREEERRTRAVQHLRVPAVGGGDLVVQCPADVTQRDVAKLHSLVDVIAVGVGTDTCTADEAARAAGEGGES